MKYHKTSNYLFVLIFSLIIFFGSGSYFDLKGEVTGVTVSVSPSSFTGQCPKLITFTARITVNTRGDRELRYRWIRSDGARIGIKGGVIVRDGVVVKTMTWTLGRTGKSYNNFWMALEILPGSYRINTIYERVVPLMTSNRAVFTLKCTNTLVTNIPSNVLTNNNIDLRFALPQYEISGRIHPDPAVGCVSCLKGRKVRVILRRAAGDGVAARTTRHVFALDRNSSFNYKFKSPFITPGTYTIRIEKGPPNQENYENELNICFRSSDPVRRTFSLTSANKKALNQDFQIEYSILWGGTRPLCW